MLLMVPRRHEVAVSVLMIVLSLKASGRLIACFSCYILSHTHPTQAREDIFQLPHTEHPLLSDIKREFEPIAALWRVATSCSRQLPDWMDGPFTEIDAEAVANDVDR